VIPKDAKLTPWPDDLLKKWDALTSEEKKLFIRQAEVYAAYLAYTDHEIGRVIEAVKKMGKLDNTLIIYISGDNGASAEGSPNGTPSEVLQFNGVELPAKNQMKWYDAWGTDQTYPHFAVPWSWAFDTPINGRSKFLPFLAARAKAWRFHGPGTSRTRAESPGNSIM
jgi:arylsulfatase